MDYEKKYKEALEIAKNINNEHRAQPFNVMTRVFSELKEESEDERIRKEIISALKFAYVKGVYDKHIAWLEKQGESKFEQCTQEGDKIVTNEDGTHFNVSQLERVAKKEPKFGIGDYLVNDYCKGKVIALTDDAYLLDTEQGIPFSCEHNAHLWTIQDARDGDVLAFKNNIGGIIICKSPTDYDTRSYCRFVSDNLINKEESGWDSTLLVPATKEQRDLLFQKIKEAGYEWVDNKKESKKIEIITPLFNVGDTIIKKHNSDIRDFGSFTITDINGGKYWYNDRIICDITEQDEWEFYEPVRQNPAWSEEDENKVTLFMQLTEGCDNEDELADWLKSLKDKAQPQWKPSDEQMRALHDLNLIGNLSYAGQGQELINLYNGLRKLKE